VSGARAGTRVARGTLLRFLLLPALFLAGLAAWRWTPLGRHLTLEGMAAIVASLQHTWWAPVALFASYLVLSPLGVPATPLLIAGGVIFGAVWGSVYNWIGVFAGGIVTYYLGRLLGRDFVAQIGGPRLKKMERAIAQRGFWGLVGIRFLPLPYALVNYAQALTGIRPALFMITTALGTLPAAVLYTYFSSALARLGAGNRSEIYRQIELSFVLLLLATIVPQIWQGRRRRARYRELVAARAARPLTPA
jgi:phospholipase D1/2